LAARNELLQRELPNREGEPLQSRAGSSLEVCVSGMKKKTILDTGGMEISGKFLGYDGAVRPW
jgi:hypothetical protein